MALRKRNARSTFRQKTRRRGDSLTRRSHTRFEILESRLLLSAPQEPIDLWIAGDQGRDSDASWISEQSAAYDQSISSEGPQGAQVGLPDLVPDPTGRWSGGAIGYPAAGSWVIHNTGDASAESFWVQFCVKDEWGWVLPFGSAWVPELGAGESLEVHVQIEAIRSDYYFDMFDDLSPTIRVDSSNSVEESDETNNEVADEWGYFSIGETAYLECAPSEHRNFSPTEVAIGEPWQIDWGFYSDSPYLPITVPFYASTDDQITEDDILIGTCDPDQLGGSQDWSSWPHAAHLELSDFPGMPLGDYYVGAVLDSENTWVEFNEANNVGIAPSMLTVQAPVASLRDYTVGAMTPDSPMSVAPGQAWSCSWDFSADGEVEQTPSFRLYADSLVTGESYLLDEGGFLGRIRPGQTVFKGVIDIDEFPDLPGGEYVLRFVLDEDNVIPELHDYNNEGTHSELLVVVANPPGPDLIAAGQRGFSTPATAGERWVAGFGVANQGELDAGGFMVSFYASRDTEITGQDQLLGDVWVEGMDAGRSFGIDLDLSSFPNVISGEYYVGILIDTYGHVDEKEEGNNGYTHLDWRMEVDGSELAEVKGVVFNDTNGDGGFDPSEEGLRNVTVFLDANGNGQWEDGERRTMSCSTGYYTLPDVAPGTYTLIAEADRELWSQTYPDGPGRYELTLAAQQFVNGFNFGFTPDDSPVLPDLAARTGTFDVTPDDISGRAIQVKFEIENRGVGALEGNVEAAFYISLDGDISPGEDFLLGSMELQGPLAAGESTGPQVFGKTIPEGFTIDPSETYYVGMVVDRKELIAESNEANNMNQGEGTDVEHMGYGEIRGTVWEDVNGNRVQDGQEQGLIGWTVYADLDQNGEFDSATEPSALTTADGTYELRNLTPGTYSICEVVPRGWEETYPGSSTDQVVTLGPGDVYGSIDFGNACTMTATVSFRDRAGNPLSDRSIIPTTVAVAVWADQPDASFQWPPGELQWSNNDVSDPDHGDQISFSIPPKEVADGKYTMDLSVFGSDHKRVRFEVINGETVVDIVLTYEDVRIGGGGSPSEVLTYKFARDSWYNMDGQLVGDAEFAQEKAAIRSALDTWESSCCVEFVETGQLIPDFWFVKSHASDGLLMGGADARTIRGGIILGTKVYFAYDVDWTMAKELQARLGFWGPVHDPLQDLLSLESGALHEVGHVLGLNYAPTNGAEGRYPDTSHGKQWSIMTYNSAGYVPWLGWSDVASVKKIYDKSWIVTTSCPVDLVVTDDSGSVVSKTLRQIPNATYIETDLNGDGDPDDQILIPDPTSQTYSIRIIPEAGADPDAPVTLVVEDHGVRQILLDNVLVADLPDEPIVVCVDRAPPELMLDPTPTLLSPADTWVPVHLDLQLQDETDPSPEMALVGIQPSWDADPATVIRDAESGEDDRDFELLVSQGSEERFYEVTYAASDATGNVTHVTERIELVGVLQGRVYVDEDGDGADGGEVGIAGVAVALAGTDSAGSTVERTTVTESDGSYTFADIPPGTYTIVETQPDVYVSATTTAGTLGGDVVGNTISQIVVGSGQIGTGYDFGELDPAALAEDLGVIDQVLLSSVDPSSGDLWYSFTTVRAGILTLEAIPSPGGAGGVVTLFDEEMGLLETSQLQGESQRIDWQTLTGESYYARVSGTDSTEFRLTNLVATQGAEIQVTGTDEADTFEFAPSGSPLVAINGVEYPFDETLHETIVFAGGAGEDTATLTGGPESEVARFHPDHGTFGEDGFLVTVSEVTSITAHGGGGADSAFMYDSPGDDEFISRKGYGKLSGDGFVLETFDFMYNYGYATTADGGADVARMEDAPENDKFKFDWPKPGQFFGKMYGGGIYYNRAKNFEQIVATMTDGKNRVRLFDSEGDDVFYGHKHESRLYGDGFDVTVSGYNSLAAYASTGLDIAHLEDSEDDDTTRARPHKITLWGGADAEPTYEIMARRFDEYHFEGKNGGFDKAKLHDTALKDHVHASGKSASLFTNDGQLDLLYEVVDFEWVRLYASSGEDTVEKEESLEFELIYDPAMWDEGP